MEPLHPRLTDILELARQRGRVEVEWLASHFDVTPQTIRKDLNDLCDRQLLQRIHGGAVYPSGVTNFAYDARRIAGGRQQTELIGQAAAQLIPDNSSVILNIGTTTEQVALALRRHQGLMVITNNINVANILRDSPSAEVVMAGGVVRHSDGGIMGEATVDFIKQFKVDFAVIGASAIDRDGSILDYDFREVKVSQAIIAHARKTILVSDNLKFERTAPVRIADLSMIDVFVTEIEPTHEIVEICRANDVELVVTDQQPECGRHEREVHDLFVIGGGINGCGIARDAQGRGYSVVACRNERSGVRHVPRSDQADSRRPALSGALRIPPGARIPDGARRCLWADAPHIIWPLRFVLPHHKGLRPAWFMRLGLFIYDHLGGRKLLPATKTLDMTSDVSGTPLKPLFSKGFEYSDCWVDDARLVVLNAIDASERGAVIRTRHQGGLRPARRWHVAGDHRKRRQSAKQCRRECW